MAVLKKVTAVYHAQYTAINNILRWATAAGTIETYSGYYGNEKLVNPEEYKIQAAIEDCHWWFEAKRNLLRSLLESVRPDRAQPLGILDIGCGTGAQAQMLQAYGRVIAVDVETLPLRMAQTRGMETLLQTSGASLPFGDGSFDVIVASDVMEHVEDEASFLQELRRVLKDDGHFLFTVPAHPFLYSEHDRRLHHFRRYRKSSLRGALQQARFDTIRFGSFNVLLSPVVVAVRLVSRVLPPSKSDQARFHKGLGNQIGRWTMRLEAAGRSWFSHLFGITYYGVAVKEENDQATG